MDSFVFNGYKNSLLTGELKDVDKWTFYLVNKDFVDDLGSILPRIDTKNQLESFIYANNPSIPSENQAMSKYLSSFTPVRYTYKVASTTLNSERPSYVDLDNWAEFNKKYPNQEHLHSLFFVKGNVFYRTYETEELGADGKPIKKPRGFYYVETAEELRWCAEKVNGTVNNNRSDIYNNKINIVLGDNLGYGNAAAGQYKQIDFCIGSDIDRPFEGIFYGNGYAIENIELICNGNSTGIIGYLGHEGIIHTVSVRGRNVLRCNNKLSITHMVNDACDINAGFICGKNNGLISDVVFEGSVYFANFIPGVYAVSNKTDDGGNAFDNMNANPYYPDYLCINSMANIVPYIGYFNEGVFGTWAYSAGSRQFFPGEDFKKCNKGYWKCNDLYMGHSTDGGEERALNNYYPYDNYGCGEWAYPSVTDMTKNTYASVTGHTLFYSINTMFDTQRLVAGALGDWSTYLSLLKYTNTKSGNYVMSDWEIQSTQYLDKPMKMHQFNRVSYNTGLLIGCNEGHVQNIAMNAEAVTSGTYVGFMGGIAGKEAANGGKIFNNICVNLTARDYNASTRNYYISDDGDQLSVVDNNTANIVQFVTDIFGTSENNSILNSRESLMSTSSKDRIYKQDTYHKKLGVGGTRADGTFDWGSSSLLRMNINGYSGTVSGQLSHIFDIPASAYNKIMKNYLQEEAPAVEPHCKFAPATTIKSVLLANADYSGCVTAFSETVTYSGLNIDSTAEMVLTNYEIFDKRTGATYAANHPKALGIVYDFGRYGHEGSLTNDISDPFSKNSDNVAVTDDNKIQIAEANRICGTNGYDYTNNVNFAVYSVDREDSNSDWRIRSSLKAVFDKIDTTTKKDVYIYNCSIGGFVIKKRPSDNVIPTEYDRNYYKLNGIYGLNNYSYDTYDIVGATNVVLSICRENGTKYQYYTLTIPEIMNSDESIGGTNFTNKASNQFFIANYENRNANKPVVSYLKEQYAIDGCSNYKIELKSIKNVGALFGSLVLSTSAEMSNVSAYLENKHKTRFMHYTNNMTFEAGKITDLGEVVNISAFDVSAASASNNFFNDANLLKICKRNGYFETSAHSDQGPVYVKSKTLSGTEYGYISDVDGFKLYGGMRIGLYENHLMYSYPSFSHPELHDYAFDNRFAPFAAVCEFNSCNISDKYSKTMTNYVPYIRLNNVNCIYMEDNDNLDVAATRHYGPMYCARDLLYTRDIPFANGVNMLAPTYAFGIALPFIAEIKPTYMAIPSILQSPLSNIDNYGDTSDSGIYKRVGMFTIDQTVASPTNDPNYWSINLNVDLPGMQGAIDRDETIAQVTKLNGFELNNNDYSFERGKTTGNLLDHLFTMDGVRINKLYYGYINTATNHFVGGEGYGRLLTNYAEVSDTTRLGFDAQTANDEDPELSIYTQNKVLAADMYFGSDLVLKQDLEYASGYYKDPESMTIVRSKYNPYSIGEYHQYFSPVTTTAISNPTLPTKPFNHNGVNTCLTHLSKKASDPDTGWFWRGIAGNVKKSERADSYEGVDKFKYNFVKERLSITANKFSHDVQLDEVNNHYGFWFTDGLKDTIKYNNKYITKFYNGDNDEVRYDGTTLHLGAMFSEKSILQSLKTERVISAASGIICDDLQGLYVVDSNNHNVMYIDIGMGECDGTQAWSMTCSAEGVNGRGLLLGIE